VLELLKHNFGPGDVLLSTQVASPEVAAQAYQTTGGRKLLLINKEDATVNMELAPGTVVARMAVVDAAAGGDPAEGSTISGTTVTLTPFAVAVISLKAQ
jgi:hypothetical protein